VQLHVRTTRAMITGLSGGTSGHASAGGVPPLVSLATVQTPAAAYAALRGTNTRLSQAELVDQRLSANRRKARRGADEVCPVAWQTDVHRAATL
jgi:hypothetical protein